MTYLVLMLSRSPLLKTLNHLRHGLVTTAHSIYAPTQEMKTKQGMQIQIAYSKETYLTNQGMLSSMIHEHTHLGKMNQQLYINRK